MAKGDRTLAGVSDPTRAGRRRTPDGASAPDAAAEPEWKRRRRLARIFGDVLPETTRDDRDEPGERGGGTSDQWLRDQVPPHHGQ
jgi:hypothetical protein